MNPEKINQGKKMTQSNGSLSILLPQLLYSLPTIFVAVAAVVVCIINWQKAPTAALFCLIGFGLIAVNSAFGAVITALMIRSGGRVGMRELLSVVSAARIILNMAGLAFLLIAVFTGREPSAKPNLLASTPGMPPR